MSRGIKIRDRVSGVRGFQLNTLRLSSSKNLTGQAGVGGRGAESRGLRSEVGDRRSEVKGRGL